MYCLRRRWYIAWYWQDVTARIDERSDKSYATQVYYCQTIGATRMEEAKVISVLAN